MIKLSKLDNFLSDINEILNDYDIKSTGKDYPAKDIAETLLLFNIEDITKGATHYHAKEVMPHWAKQSKIKTIIGNHIFYE